MKAAFVAAAVMMLSAGVASAQNTPPAQPPAPSANCSGFAPAPTFPDGATATSRQMNAGNELYQSWGQARIAKLQACRADVEALRAQLNVLEQAYVAANTELNAVTQSWQAEAAEYNGRTRR